MHYAKLADSKRLQKLVAVLADGKRHTTRDIIMRTGICAVNSAASELRRNDVPVICKYQGMSEKRERIYDYWLEQEPRLAL